MRKCAAFAQHLVNAARRTISCLELILDAADGNQADLITSFHTLEWANIGQVCTARNGCRNLEVVHVRICPLIALTRYGQQVLCNTINTAFPSFTTTIGQ